ncbi:MAG: hypothetical protein ACFFDY_01350 [Candidatus Thorarchaeota archaeon]
MTVETIIPQREIILEPIYLVPPWMEDADKRKILDNTGNTIRDHLGRIIHDDKQ